MMTSEKNITDADRLLFLLKADCIESFVGVTKDRYEYASEVAEERGHKTPTLNDELVGFRRLIDAAREVHAS